MAGGIDSVLGSFDNIIRVLSGNGNDSLFGADIDANWTLDTTNSYASGGQNMTFSGIENLTGGSGTDIFELIGRASLPGKLDGGVGSSDTLDYSAYLSPVFVNFGDGTATGIGGSVSGLETVISNEIGVTLHGDENDNLLIGSLGKDTLRGFGGNDTLIGNGGDDILDGGNGLDTAVYSNSANGVVVDLGVGTAQDQATGTSSGTDTLISIENVIGSAFGDNLTGSGDANQITGGGGDDTLTGLGGDDTYVFSDNAGTDSVVEAADGGTDTLDFSAVTTNLNFAIASVTVTGSGIHVTHTSTHIENLIGSSGGDTFTVADGAGVTGSINGRGGSDHLDFNGYTSARTVALTALGTVDGFAGTVNGMGFENVDTFTASSGAGDSLSGLNSTANWTLNAGNSTYTSTNSLTFNGFEILNGGSQDDTVDITATVSLSINAGGGNDSLNIAEGVDLNGSFDGGSANNTLSFSGNTTGRNVVLTALGTTDGFAGTAASGTFDNINVLTGGSGSDSLTGLDAAANWTLDTGNSSYTSTNTLTFSAFETLTGGSDTDTFAFADGGTLAGGAGTINGTGGVNTLDYSAYTTDVNVNLGTGAATGTADVSNIQNIIGGQANDTLTGDGAANRITGGPGQDLLSGAGDDDTYLFVDGSGTDTVKENAASGTDTLDFSAVTTNLTFNLSSMNVADTNIDVSYDANLENVIGGSGLDTITYAGNGADHAVTLTGLGSIDGFAGTATDLPGTFDNINAFEGGSGTDMLNALNVANTWTLNGANSQLVSSGGTFGFDSTVEILNGGSDVDDFEIVGAESGTLTAGIGNDSLHFVEGASLNGSFDGGPGTDTISFNGNTTGRSIVLTALGSTDGFAGNAAGGTFDNVNIIMGGSGIDSLTGLNALSTFNLQSSTGEYTSTNNLTFSNIENLIGGSNTDTFNLADGLIFNGNVDGQGGTNTLTFAAFTSGRDVILTGLGSQIGFDGTEASLTGGFANITTLIGSPATDSLTGTKLDATWEIDGSNRYLSGAATLNFSAFETLGGGSAEDLFNISGTQTHDLLGGDGDDRFGMIGDAVLAGTIDGGPHNAGDTLDYSAYTGDVTVNLATGAATGTGGISNLEISIGGTGVNAITGDDGDNVLFGGSSNDRLIGGAGNDTYIFKDGWGNDTVIENPGEGNDTLDFSGVTGATGKLTFNFAATITVTGGGNQVDHTGGEVENFVGGNFSNDFVFGDGFLVSSVTGGTGTDSLDFSANSKAVKAELSGLGTLNGFAGTRKGMAFNNIDALTGSGVAGDSLTGANLVSQWGLDDTPDYAAGGRSLDFASFETLNGGSLADTFNLSGARTFDLDGGLGDDNFVLDNAAALTGQVAGSGGTDTLDYSSFTTKVIVDLSNNIAQNISGAIAGVENVTGGDDSDTISGDGAANVLRGGPGNDILNGMGGDDTLIGGADNDTLNGGSDNDTFLFELNAWGEDVVDELAGEGFDTMDFSPLSDNLDIDLGSVTVTSGINTATHAGTSIENVIAGSGNDQFTINENQSTNLSGGPGKDTFTFADGAALTGTLSGDDGTDELSFAPNTASRNIALTRLGSSDGFAGTATGLTGTFSDIDILTGSSAADSLTGLNALSTWDIAGTHPYTSTNSLSFSGFETLQGGSSSDVFNISGNQPLELFGGAGKDSFVFEENGYLDGDLDGQQGDDEIDFSAFTTARRIVLTAIGAVDGLNVKDYSPAPAISGLFKNMNDFVGSSDIFNDDILVGLNIPGQWTIAKLSTYQANPTMTFSGFETLVGGDAADIFTIKDVQGVTILGGDGDDKFVLSCGSSVNGTLSGQGGSDTLEYGLATLPAYDISAETATGVLGGISGIELFTLTPPPIRRPSLPLVESAGEKEETILVEIPLVTQIVMVTRLLEGELASLDGRFINILFSDEATQVMFAIGIDASASITNQAENDLSLTLPTGYRFYAALTVELIDEAGNPVKELPNGTWMNISFALPEDYQDHIFVLLYWDETLNNGAGGWVEIQFPILYGDSALNDNISEIMTYYRYWDAVAGEWVTISALAEIWDELLSETLDGWLELPGITENPTQTEAVLAGQSIFTGTFVLVTVETEN